MNKKTLLFVIIVSLAMGLFINKGNLAYALCQRVPGTTRERKDNVTGEPCNLILKKVGGGIVTGAGSITPGIGGIGINIPSLFPTPMRPAPDMLEQQRTPKKTGNCDEIKIPAPPTKKPYISEKLSCVLRKCNKRDENGKLINPDCAKFLSSCTVLRNFPLCGEIVNKKFRLGC